MKRFIIALLICSLIPSVTQAETGRDAVKLMAEGKVKKALAILEKLADKGETQAMVQLGIYYYQGTKVKQDYAKAMDWFLKAEKLENADAFVNLGVMHRDGNGVPKNKKIAYTIFLTTHMCGLGSESTQMRSNQCLRKLVQELNNEEIRDILSHYTLPYLKAYIEAKGKLVGIPKKYQPTKEQPALKDLGWFLDSEIDAIFGPPSDEVKKARILRDKKHEEKIAALERKLEFEFRFTPQSIKNYQSYSLVSDSTIVSSPIKDKNIKSTKDNKILSNFITITKGKQLYLTMKRKDNVTLVYPINKLEPHPWSEWTPAAYALKDSMDVFTLLHGRKPRSKTSKLPKDAPSLRIKVSK